MKKTFCLISALLAGFIIDAYAQSEKLPDWEPGNMDIHFIATAQGESAYIIMPDGTTMLIDAGATSMRKTEGHLMGTLPDDSRTPGQWIADYIRMFAPKGREVKLDYVLISHYDDDHIGSYFKRTYKDEESGLVMTRGITDVCMEIPVGKYVDRGDWPLGNEGVDMKKESLKYFQKRMDMYRPFIAYLGRRDKTKYEEFKVGSEKQFVLKYAPRAYKNFKVHNLFANGFVDGEEGIVHVFDDKYYEENAMSTGIKISYGKFDYYTGGDAQGVEATNDKIVTRSLEYPAAPAIGQVDVAKMDHHGVYNAMSNRTVSHVAPRVWLGSVWHAVQPSETTLVRIRSKKLYKGDRELYLTWCHPANRAMYGDFYYDKPLSGKTEPFAASLEGHIVVRVAPGGDTYDIYVLDARTPEREVKQVRHYESR